ncbi:MAG: DNA recombination protein RmuC [Actinomycetota bacterium]|jgi:DNA recombination protein RmuC|nr:DNA recombination protein RmuC [Actinomycetota bacterium]MDA3012022.1 DNA recombination protein RmuC [Actinomycetota bacterium]MDA3024594.1 DNA recombination protein RmuC [Actinomycetota bacterium]
MNTVLLVVVIVLLAAAVALQLRTKQHPVVEQPVTPAVDPALLQAQLSQSVSTALADALERLNDEARKTRDETVQLVTKAGVEQIGAKGEMINQSLTNVADQVAKKMSEIDQALTSLRESTSKQYGTVEQAVAALTRRTDKLNDVLSSSQARGQWGERLAEDMLRAAGFVEGVNYSKQATIDGGGRPDYRFDIPPDRVLFMDVKFPLDKYAEYVAADTDQHKAATKEAFIRAVKDRVIELAKRDYVDKASDNTVDYVLMFIPNESISGFVHEADPKILDFALERKVVLCSPLNLYAFLAVIRQATDAFHTEKTAAEIMQIVNRFQKQWDDYLKAVDKVEKSFHSLESDLASINTGGTRFRMLSAQVKKIEKLRQKQGIPELPAALDDDVVDAEEIDD